MVDLLKSTDIRKIIREIVLDILHNKDTLRNEDNVEEVEEDLGPMPMEIDVARLENAKDLLAVNGKVNGIDIQCLADSCANVSFIQEEAIAELQLEVDRSIKHDITGASGSNETLGIVKNVSIELAPGCVIKDDLVVLKGYKHREIGLSRACLRRYNYDVLESRKFIILTHDETNYSIPIVPDANRA